MKQPDAGWGIFPYMIGGIALVGVAALFAAKAPAPLESLPQDHSSITLTLDPDSIDRYHSTGIGRDPDNVYRAAFTFKDAEHMRRVRDRVMSVLLEEMKENQK